MAPQLASAWSIKDVMAHLVAWQQVSNARLEAGQPGTQPVQRAWLSGEDPIRKSTWSSLAPRSMKPIASNPGGRCTRIGGMAS